MKFNLSKILAVLGAVGVLAPDLAGVASWLSSLGGNWAIRASHIIGGLALLAASMPRIIEGLRPLLSAINLASPPAAETPVVVQPTAIDKPGAALVLVLAASMLIGCKNTKPDSFYSIIVTCTEQNTGNSQAGIAVLGCLEGAVGGDYTACLAGLVTAGHWTIDEVACIVRATSTSTSQRLNAGAAKPTDSVVLKNANSWLTQERIGFR